MTAQGAAGVAIVGLGNPLMGDDGVGVAVVRMLQGQALPEGTDLYDAGTALLDVLPAAGSRAKMVIVDSCRAGGRPGTVYRTTLHPDEWETTPPCHSLHDLDAVHALRLHRLAGGRLGEVVLIGVEPAEVLPRNGLSPALRRRLPLIVRAVRQELQAPATRPGGTQ